MKLGPLGRETRGLEEENKEKNFCFFFREITFIIISVWIEAS